MNEIKTWVSGSSCCPIRRPSEENYERGCFANHGTKAYYTMTGQKGAYTQKKGLDRETNKTLLLKHIQENTRDGSRLKELMQVLPASTRRQVQRFLLELRSEGKIELHGSTRSATWHAIKE